MELTVGTICERSIGAVTFVASGSARGPAHSGAVVKTTVARPNN